MPPAPVLAALVALIGCGGAGRPARPEARTPAAITALDACEAYRTELPEAWRPCLARAALAQPDAAGMTAVCALTGPGEAECHGRWVDEMRLRGRLDADELLAACAPDEDCALRVLDATAVADPVVQLSRCRAWSGRYLSYCVGHALDRWARTRPDEAEFARILAVGDQEPEQVGTKLGMVVACGHVGACPEEDSILSRACRHAVDDVAHQPDHCAGIGPPR